MREQVRDKGRLEHILEQIIKIEDVTRGFDYEHFCNDHIRFAALCYYTMIIGEATYMLTKEFKESHSQTPWRQIEGMRHHIVHGYYQVRNDILWNVIKNEIQPLKHQIQQYLSEF